MQIVQSASDRFLFLHPAIQKENFFFFFEETRKRFGN